MVERLRKQEQDPIERSTTMARIFLSHSSEDREFAGILARDLKKVGHTPWLDEWDIRVGDEITQKIAKGLDECDFVIVILTPNAIASKWVEREWMTAYWTEVEARKIVVLPVLLKDCDIPLFLKTKKYADFRREYLSGLIELNNALTPMTRTAVDLPDPNGHATQTELSLSILISRAQNRAEPLSKVIADALTLAIHIKDSDLREFCKREITGFSDSHPLDSSVSYRLFSVYASYNRINMSYVGWDGDVNNVINYMNSHPDDFRPIKLFEHRGISVIESEVDSYNRTPRGLVSISTKLGNLNPKTENPEIEIICYARFRAYEQILQSIRSVLTAKLLERLPP